MVIWERRQVVQYRNKLLILSILIVMLILTGCSTNTDRTANLLKLSGRITDYSTNNNGISNVNISVNDGEYKTETNSKGQFSLYLPRGNAEIIIKKDGYWREQENIYLYTDYTTNYYLKDKLEYSGMVSGYLNINQLTSTNKMQVMQVNNKPDFNRANTYSTNLDNDYVEGELLVEYEDSKAKNSILKSDLRLNNNLHKVSVPAGKSTEEYYQEIKNSEEVKSVSYNYKGYLMTVPNDEYLFKQWTLEKLDLYKAWNFQTGSDAISVAVIDTGYLAHPDIEDNLDLVNGKDFVDGDEYAIDEDANGNRMSHGTHVAGIIGAEGNNGSGISGVNWDINIIPIRIFSLDSNGQQYFTTDRLIKAIKYAIEEKADIINLSLAYVDDNNPNFKIENVEEILKEAVVEHGIIITASAGNSELGFPYYPASSEYTIAVGATGPTGEIASYSNYGNGIDIYAPGGDVAYLAPGSFNINGAIYGLDGNYDTSNYNQYTYSEGTSMAAPHVAGVAALLLAENVSAKDVRERLVSTAEWIDDPRAGRGGLLNANLALSTVFANHNQFEEYLVAGTIKEDNTYYIMSDLGQVDNSGKYIIPHVKVGEGITIIGWQDINNSEEIDTGDMFGEIFIANYLNKDEHLSNLDFTLTEIPAYQVQSPEERPEIIFGPPPGYYE